MAVIKEDAVLRAVLARLRAVMAAAGDPVIDNASVYIRAVAGFDNVNPPYVQIVPGPGELNTMSPDGLVTQSFQVYCYKRLALDEEGKDTIRISDESLGLMLARNKHRGDPDTDPDAPTGLIGHFLDLDPTAGTQLLSHAILLRSWAAPIANPLDPSWVACSDTYQVKWPMYETLPL